MLIDASHPEETRVVVQRGNRIDEFDFESASRKPLRGNIYLAKVTRVEPSLQAAFIEYGGNRHGFLAFSEIHPDYYQIPVADREALLAEEARFAEQEEQEEAERQRDDRGGRRGRRRRGPKQRAVRAEASVSEQAPADEAAAAAHADDGDDGNESAERIDDAGPEAESPVDAAASADIGEASHAAHDEANSSRDGSSDDEEPRDNEAHHDDAGEDADNGDEDDAEEDETENGEPQVEQIGGGSTDALEDMREQRRAFRPRRQYKIQEVIKRRQILLVQVVKEERGNKGAALTTYLSLAGRYSVLMPNTARGGGVSRKITNSADRKRLKELATDLDVPEGMGVILRTAGASRTTPEIKRDFEYLLRVWEQVRETTLQSVAPTLVYEEGSLIKRSLRDLFGKEVDEVLVAGDAGYREARDFMKMLMPSQVKAIKAHRDPQPLFARYGVEGQLDAMFSSNVTLKSGGYIVINPTEALVSIDVNSGRSTREHNIEDTALKTNLEAADEVARQVRLRDLAGLIVIDFIDMEEHRNNRAVEKRLKDALKNDRARIQVGRISAFGLLEMSRQRMRTGVLESSTMPCPHCSGSGFVRATSSVALLVLRAIEEALLQNATFHINVRTRTEVALYILNQKRLTVRGLEERFGVSITIGADDSLHGTNYFVLERGEHAPGGGLRVGTLEPSADEAEDAVFVGEDEAVEAAETDENGEPAAEGERGEDGGRRGRRRRRRGRGRDREFRQDENGRAEDAPAGEAAEDGEASDEDGDDGDEAARDPQAAGSAEDRDGRRRRRRGRRGGRRFRRGGDETGAAPAAPSDEAGDDGGDMAGEPVEETVAEAPEASSDAAVEPQAPAGPEKPKRRRSKAATAADEAAKAGPEADEAAPEPARPKRGRGKAKAAAEPAAEPAAEAPEAAAAALEPTPAPVPAVPPPPPVVEIEPEVEDPNRPKRTGWWSKARKTDA
jgi:ribonuclease E